MNTKTDKRSTNFIITGGFGAISVSNGSREECSVGSRNTEAIIVPHRTSRIVCALERVIIVLTTDGGQVRSIRGGTADDVLFNAVNDIRHGGVLYRMT